MDFAWSDQQRELLDAVGRFASQQLNYDVIANDRHIRWETCGPRCDSLTAVQQQLIDDLVAASAGGEAVRVKGTHALIDEHPREVRELVLARLGSARASASADP